MKKIFALIIGLTLLCGSLFPVAADQQGETRLPHHAEFIPPPTWGGEELPAEEDPEESQPSAGAQALAGTLGSGAGVSALQSAGIQASGEGLTVNYDGFTAELTKYGVNKYTSDADLYLFFHVVNNTDQVLNLTIDDVVLDGVDLMSTGIYEIQPGSDNKDENDRVWIMSKPGAPEGTDAILDAKTLEGTLILKDDETREELLLQEFTLDLTQIESMYNDFSSNDEDTASGSSDSSDLPDAAYSQTPSYRTLQQGATGEDVRKLQQALIDLGYLYDTPDGSYGPRTAAAVKEFNEANGLYGGTTADRETQELAFSGLANPYTEPWIPLDIGANFHYEPIPSVNTFFFKVEVTNHTRSRTIKGYELSLYYTDVWGKWLDGGVIYTQTMTQPVAPGQTIYSANFNLGNWYSVDTVWVGVSKIVFDDGEIRELDPDDIVYYSCTIPTRIN